MHTNKHNAQTQNAHAQGRAFERFTRLAIKTAEHTWGLSFDQHLNDASNYSNAHLHAALADLGAAPNYALVIDSWRRQRRYLDWALAELPPGHAVRAAVEADRTERRGHARRAAAMTAAAAGGGAWRLPAGAARVALPAAAERQAGAGADGARGGGAIGWLARLRGWLGLGLGGGGGGGGVEPRLRRGGSRGSASSSSRSSSGRSNDALVFRSHAWEFEIDPYRGGLSSLRRLYPANAPGAAPRRGHDWAADAPGCGGGAAAAAASAACGDDDDDGDGDEAEAEGGSDSSGGGRRPRAARPRFLGLQYDLYSPDDYAPVWRDYAYVHPVWTGDFGKLNLSAASGALPSARAAPFLADVAAAGGDEGQGLTVHLKYEFPRRLALDAGAPAAAWVALRSPPGETTLRVAVAWVNKTATRLPEAGWVRFTPGRGAVDPSRWRLHKVAGEIDPNDIMLNGSHSVHGLSDRGLSMISAGAVGGGGDNGGGAGGRVGDARERLRVRPLDAPLFALGDAAPFPNPRPRPRAMRLGASALLHTNVWGTNYAMWFPFTLAGGSGGGGSGGSYADDDDASIAWRFEIEAEEVVGPAAE